MNQNTSKQYHIRIRYSPFGCKIQYPFHIQYATSEDPEEDEDDGEHCRARNKAGKEGSFKIAKSNDAGK